MVISCPAIDSFYSVPTESWLKVIGEKLHYHFGRTNPQDPMENIMDHMVRCFYPFIPNDSAILDCGCGWGGPARLIASEKGCKVTGVTTSSLQYEFIKTHVKEIKVIYGDLHQFVPHEKFRCALFLEVATHLVDPRRVFTNLYPQVDAVLLSEYIAKVEAFYDPRWQMYFRTKQEIIDILCDSGYTVEHYEEALTSEDIRKSARYWLDGLAQLRETEVVGQLKLLKACASYWSECQEILNWTIGLFYAKKRDCL